MTDSSKRLRFSGAMGFQFMAFLQGVMQTQGDGSQVFVGVIRGAFGVPPNGSGFEAQVKLSVGASFAEDAYEVTVPPQLADLGARPEFRKAAFDYVNMCMSSMVGPSWRHMTGLTATNNVIQIPGPLVTIQFPDTPEAW